MLLNRSSNEKWPVEPSLYYITSRYYNPELGRFILPDSVDYSDLSAINGLDLYAYCGNDPINYCGPSGHFAILSFLAGLGISALTGAAVGAFSYIATGGLSYLITDEFTWLWAQFVGSAIGGAIGGALLCFDAYRIFLLLRLRKSLKNLNF